MFWNNEALQLHFWEDINPNKTFILNSHRPFICSVWKSVEQVFTLGTWQSNSESIQIYDKYYSPIPLSLFKSVHCKDTIPKIQNIYFQKRNCAASVPISTFICLWSVHIFFCSRRPTRPILGIYKSLTDTWMWKLGLRPCNSFSRNT